MPKTLNEIMSFEHVIEVHPDGTITEPRGIYAPELLDGELDCQGWELLDGYSGQHGYSGPEMHSSEFIAGGMEDEIRSTPGVYVAIVAYTSPDPDETDSDGNPFDSGWAVARMTGK